MTNSDKQTAPRWWTWIAQRAGGIYECGPLVVVIHDDGAMVAWRQVEKWEWTP